ncbi:MAG: hypothetical protein P4L75_04710 [Clostridia bacterium]|nr:hypothetical protein [Clostridia bacterium]MDR3644788.1 hypothetical protein [Clostridia bacterium]
MKNMPRLTAEVTILLFYRFAGKSAREKQDFILLFNIHAEKTSMDFAARARRALKMRIIHLFNQE